MNALRYTLSKLRAATDVFASTLIHSPRPLVSLGEAVERSLEQYHSPLTFVIYLSGEAMAPSLNYKSLKDRDSVDALLVRRIPNPSRSHLSVGDVVAFDSPYRYGDDLCVLVRRITAMDGETLISDVPTQSFVVPPGHCWVVADNKELEPPDVVDSRYFGPLPFENVRGRVIYSGYSRNDHSVVKNSSRALRMDAPVLQCELDLNKMFPEGGEG